MENLVSYHQEAANEATERVSKLLREINAIKQNRSDYVLEHFVVMQHDLPGRQRLQILDELEALFFATLDMIDDREMARLDLEEIAKTTPGTPLDEERVSIKMRRAQRAMMALEMQINSRTREINTLLGMLDQLPEYTREQLEKEEEDYWKARLMRQGNLSQIGASTALGEGNLEALLQTREVVGKARQSLEGGAQKIVGLLRGENG